MLKRAILDPDAITFDFAEFVAGETSIDEIIKSVNTFPMLSKRKLVFLNDTHKLKDSEQAKLLESMRGFSARSTLVLIAEELDRRKRFYKTLRDKACVAQFAKLKGFALERWAESFVRRRGYRISSAAIKKIVAMAGTDLQTLSNELEKVLLYSGESKTVEDSVVDEIVLSSPQSSIFELIGAMSRRDRTTALRLLANLLDMGEHPLYVLTMMARHCRQVLIAKDHMRQGSREKDIIAAAQIPPYFLDRFLGQVRGADTATIQRMMIELADIDRKLKSSAGNGRTLLQKLICNLV